MVKIVDILGIKTIINKIEDDASFTLSICFNTGSMEEKENEKGISHMLEHMMFTGTNKRNNFEISEEMDFYGAKYNAYTSKEITCYYFTSLSNKQKITSEIFFDMITDPIFPEDQIKKEKEIIFEEIKMSKDDIWSVVYEQMQENLFKGNVKYNVIGTEESVGIINRDMLIDYYRRNYTRDNMIISVSGNFDELLLENQIKEYFSRLLPNKTILDFEKNDLIKIDYIDQKVINQVNIYLLTKNTSYKKTIKDYYIEFCLECIMGDGFSSRLFQEVREKRGLAYLVNTINLEYQNLKTFAIYIGTSTNKYKEAIDVTYNVIDDLIKNGVTERELEKVKNSILSSRASSKENSKIVGKYINMYRKFGDIYTDKEVEKILLSITVKDINEKAKSLLKDFSTCVIGDIDGK
ncbi:insulinase family protein [Streptobacillus felis]|uniref:Insulinase family protein n=1 Tax=Streptobacillus felis TaxID=1384509 RepID=A0A7Z0PDZ1_9FUSO|nr:pitrilysin family protein [Streptobacillus felis]NYV27254.1 insulinase family protein [Streptobacillus felis]